MLREPFDQRRERADVGESDAHAGQHADRAPDQEQQGAAPAEGATAPAEESGPAAEAPAEGQPETDTETDTETEEDVEAKPGDSVLADIFAAEEKVHVVGKSKGRGFQGVIKRHNFGGGKASHGSMFHRAPGSIGQNQTPGRVFKGQKMSGHMGNVRRTQQNLEVVRVDAERNLLLVKGAVPGSKGGDVVIRPEIKAR